MVDTDTKLRNKNMQYEKGKRETEQVQKGMPYGHFAPQRTLKKEIHSLKPVYSQTSVIKGKPKKLKNNKPQNFLEHSKIKKRTTEQHNHRIQT